MINKLAAAAACLAGAALLIAGPAEAKGREVVIDIGDGDLLEKLIKLDAEGIADMRADIAEARRDIEEAILEIEEARREVGDEPGAARFVLRIAFSAAREATEAVVAEAMAEARKEIDDAERKLKSADVSAAERAETQGAIDGLRDDLDDLEDALLDLIEALRA